MRPSRERIAGFRAEFAAAGIDPADGQVCIQASPMDFAQGDTLALLGGRERSTVVIALGTRILAGVLRAARDLKLSVPADLSVLSSATRTLPPCIRPPLRRYAGTWKMLGARPPNSCCSACAARPAARSRARCCRSTWYCASRVRCLG